MSLKITRALFCSTPHKPALWIHAGNAHISRALSNRFFKLPQEATWSKDFYSAQRGKPLKVIPTSSIVTLGERDASNSIALKGIFEERISQFSGDIFFFNALGGAHPKEGETLEGLNKTSALAFAEAIDSFSKEKREKGWRGKSVLIHCSSIAATILPETEYGRVKKETDEALVEGNTYPAIDLVLCLRIGYIVESLLPGRRETPKEHDFGPDQLVARLPAQPIIKGPIKQMIYPIHMDDVVDAILNTPNHLYQKGRPSREIISVTGDQPYTQEQFLTIFAEALNKPLALFEVSANRFLRIAQAFPHGHIAPYAAQYFMNPSPHTVLDTQPLKKLLGRELTPLDIITMEAKSNKDEIIIRSPVLKYLKVIVKRILKGKANLAATKDLISLVHPMALAWMKSKLED